MSIEYYLIKWRNTILTLENLIKLDCEYQERKAHDKQWCDAVQRLSRILGSYIASYNDAVDCLHQNMQIQKTVYITNVVNAIVARILELQNQLRKLEGTCYQFLSKGLIDQKLTCYDSEFRRIPNLYKRPENIENAVIEALEKVKTTIEEVTEEEEEEEKNEKIFEKINWWEDDEDIQGGDHHGINITEIYEVQQIISEESLERKNKIALIQAQEKTRQITKIVIQQKQRRVLWEKELKGILKPAASRELRERSAHIIQRVIRCFFKIKRDKIKQCKRDELLQIKLCNKPNVDYKTRDDEITQRRIESYKIYEKQLEIDCEKYIEDYKKRKGDEIAEDFRDYIRDWFQKWYVEAKFFYDIPKEKQGGSLLIMQEEVPLPSEWLDQYKDYLEDKKANKNKTALQLKYEKLAQKEEAMLLRREELQKKKLEAQLLKKMMKNPTLHPGYNYPMSKKIEHLRESIHKYNKDWSDLDSEQREDVKENYIHDLNEEHLCMIAKIDILKDTEPSMREELKVLKKALAEEYKSNDEVMPKKIQEKMRGTKKKRKMKSDKEEYIQDKLIITQRRIESYKIYEKQLEIDCEKYIEDYKKRKGDEIAEDFRDYIRDWFQKWYVEAKFFYDIPKEKQGGSLLIMQEEVPLPSEWLDQYKDYLEDKKANKNKTALQLKYEKLAQKEEAMLLRREELQKKKLEAQLLKKMMKNPTLHPGYNYPMSKKIEHLRESIHKYNKDWSDLDSEQREDVKENYIHDLNEEHLCMIAKIDILKDTEPSMREELKVLKKALAEEYKSNDEVMPKKIQEKMRGTKKKRKMKSDKEEYIQDKLIELAENGILKEYPVTSFADFLGDPNYAGDDFRCNLRSPLPFGAETRSIWWERCREVMHGFRRILLVGPRSSGKTTLAHVMATETNAVFYELDPSQIALENQTTHYLNKLITSLVKCAEVTQPSIIFIKHVHMLFYSKVPPEDSYIKFDLIKRYFIRKLFKKIRKHCNVTIIGSCVNPWMTRSKQLLKKFYSVLLLPDTSYSAVQLILRNWVINNRIVPSDLDIHSLAYFLKGYPFGLISKALEDFLSADEIVKIAAYGLSAIEVYNYILDNYEVDLDYDKYVSWYTNNTHWGKIEIKRLEERIEFKSLVDHFNEKMKKKKQH